MSNSFYYFFSAAPQVLGGILALFGVFVIFKIQGLKNQLIGISRPLLNIIDQIHAQEVSLENRMTNVVTSTSINLKASILREDTYEIKAILDGVSITYSLFKDEFESLRLRFNTIYNSFQILVRGTIKWSIFTATLIIFCLSTIPFGEFILNHLKVLYVIFGLVILGIGLSFYGLISILKKALIDSGMFLS